MCLFQVETIGSMDVQEKANYLLEQVRLVLAKKDFVRTEIIAKKLAVKQFAEPGAKEDPKWQAIKIKYYSLMIEYHKHYAHYYEIAKAYREVRKDMRHAVFVLSFLFSLFFFLQHLPFFY